MDQAFITIWEKYIKRLRFDSRTADGVRHAESKNAFVSQLKCKLIENSQVILISVCKMDISFKITVK